MAGSGEMAAFRLILADEAEGQQIKTCRTLPSSVAELVQLLQEDFDLKDMCDLYGLDPDTLNAEGGGLLIVGLDGARRVHIRSDAALVEFLSRATETATPGGTRLPSLEVRLVTAATPRNSFKEGREESRKDSVDKGLTQRLEELERAVRNSKLEAQSFIDVALRDFTATQERVLKAAMKAVEAKVDKVQAEDSNHVQALKDVRKDMQAMRNEMRKMEGRAAQAEKPQAARSPSPKPSASQDISGLDHTADILGITQDATQLRELVQQLQEAVARQEEVIKELGEQLNSKVEEDRWQQEETNMGNRITEMTSEIEAMVASAIEEAGPGLVEQASGRAAALEKSVQEMESKVEEVSAKMEEVSEGIESKLEESSYGLETKMQEASDAAQDKLEGQVREMTDGLEKANASLTEQLSKLSKRCEELVSEQALQSEAIKSSVNEVKESKSGMEGANKESEQRAAAMQRRFDELSKRTEATFLQLNERLEEMARVERARLGSLEKDCMEGVTLARSECRGETERLRMDYEKESARLDQDLGELHTKQDLNKQEMNFVQARLIEQREWAEAQINELRTAAKVNRDEIRDKDAAATKMLYALRDDAVGFREKMGGHIASLQQSTDSQGDAIGTLETQRSRMRQELDVLQTDHKSYVEDMDGWADDVRLKVERLFRALEPSRVEWYIARVERKAKELKRPLGLKSQGFSVKGLREVAMEFYPEGHHTSPEGFGVVRVFLPQDAHVRYQVWIGRVSEGVREHQPGSAISIDVLVENWKDQMLGDGSLSIALEVLRDYKDSDQSLARDIRIESP